MEDGCWSAPEILAWREPRQIKQYVRGYTGMTLIMGNTPKVDNAQPRLVRGKSAVQSAPVEQARYSRTGTGATAAG